MNDHKVKRGRGRPPKHGAYSKAELVPLTRSKVDMIVAMIKGEQLMSGPTDAITIEVLGRMLAKLDLMDRFFAEHGIFSDEVRGTPQPVWPHYTSTIREIIKLCNLLGLTPAGRIKMGLGSLQAEDMATKIARARQS